MNDWTPLTECVACSGTRLKQFLDLGAQPLANHFHDGTKELPRYPLGLNLCLDCGHSQQLVAVNPHLMFDHYDYVSGTSNTLAEYFRTFAELVAPLFSKCRVLDIGANDGSLLRQFKRLGCDVLGVDPATNIRPPDLPWVPGYWNGEATDYLIDKGAQFDVIVAMNVVAHTADPATFLKLCKEVLAPTGRVYVQVSQCRMIELRQFDTVYAEHISFFQPSSFIALARRAGLNPVVVHERAIHGRSLLVEFENRECAHTDIEAIERTRALSKEYDSFQFDAQGLATTLCLRVEDARDNGFAVVGLGAAAKAMTVLNFGDIRLDYIVDENPLKIGKLTPGMNIPVLAFDALRDEARPCAFVLTSWNFAEELLMKVQARRGDGRGDKVISYFPEQKVWAL